MSEKKERRPLTEEELAASKRLLAIWNREKQAMHLTQMSAGHVMGITQGAVGHYLNGRAPLNLEAVLKFAALLKCHPKDIYSEIIPYGMEQYLDTGFGERDARDKEVLMVAEEIKALPDSQRVALRAYLKALADANENDSNSKTSLDVAV